ncbi:Evx1p [Homalodisca vitripennis]|nr:Evx1p [Homalodisca vitripennis]
MLQVWFQNRRMKDKRQRMAMAWPYAVYTDPAFAASILQAAAASAGGLAAVAANYPYPPAYYPPRYTPYPLPRPGPGFPLDMETPLIPPFPQSSPQFCHLSPTPSETSGTLSPERRERDRENSPDDCDGSASCRCGIINCVTGNSVTPAPGAAQFAPPVSLLHPAPRPPAPLLVTSDPLPSSKPLSEQPKKLFQPYKTDISERFILSLNIPIGFWQPSHADAYTQSHAQRVELPSLFDDSGPLEAGPLEAPEYSWRNLAVLVGPRYYPLNK